MSPLFRKCRNWLSYKHINEKKLEIKTIELKVDDISYFNLSTNSIISFTYEGELFYFRECPLIVGMREYFYNAVERFFSMLGRSRIDSKHFKQKIPIKIDFDTSVINMFYDYLNHLLCISGFVKKISRAGEISRRLGFSIWDVTSRMYNEDFFCAFGLKDLPKECYDISIYFIWYMRGVSFSYETRKITRSKTHSYFSAVKSISCKIVADSIGLNHMIPETDLCRIELDDGSFLFGVLSAAANGSRMIDSKVKMDGSLQKELSNLNILDLICFQPDHGANNYNVYQVNGKNLVCAFDNDNPITFLPLPYIRYNFGGCSSVVNRDGRYNRPYIDQELYDNIRNLDIVLLKKKLMPYLNSVQIHSLILRLRSIKKIFKKSVTGDRRMVMADDDWNMETIAEEMSGKYGKTYLTLALSHGIS